MFVEMVLSGVKRHVTQHQVRALESMGWQRVLGANQDSDSGKKDALSQNSPSSPKRKTK
jgi:hypothetical protein